MCFSILMEARSKNELILIDGGMCHFHLRKDGQLTIREIISTKFGAGKEILSMLMVIEGVKFIIAKCPTWLDSNVWYQKNGFYIANVEKTKSGKEINVWRKDV